MEIPTIHLTRQEVERAALELGAKLRTIQQWRYRGVPARWRLKLIEHFGAIVIDGVASETLPPVKQRTLADICREKFLTPSGLS
jgi:hypothetical protein